MLSLLPLLPGTIILTAAEHEAMLYVGRVILGFGVGFAIQVRQAADSAPSRCCHAGEPASVLFRSCWRVLILLCVLLQCTTRESLPNSAQQPCSAACIPLMHSAYMLHWMAHWHAACYLQLFYLRVLTACVLARAVYNS